MRRFVTAVFRHETNTFSPVPTPLDAFGRHGASRGPISGMDAVRAYEGTGNPVAAYIDLAREQEAELDFAVACNAVPSGPADDHVVDFAAERIIASLRKGCDGLFLDLHGGMVTKGYDDPEGELLRRIRAEFPDLPIAAALDFHSNLSQATIDNATVITGYRTYPHVDMYEAGQRAGRTLLRAIAGEVRPVMVWHSLPILSHLNRQTPSRQPMKDIMDRAIAAEASGEVLNASVFGCFPLADIPHVGLHAVIVADSDISAGRRLLQEIMTMAWERRAEFVFPNEPIEQSLATARKMAGRPIVLADHGDVAGSGGSTDVMEVLREAIRQGFRNVCAGPIWDPAAVRAMQQAGLGPSITLQLGGKTDFPAIGMRGRPLEISGVVKALTDGRFRITGPMMTGLEISLGACAVLDTGMVEIVVSEERHEPFDIGCFTHAGIDPREKDFILIKSRQHFRAGFEPIMAGVVMVAGPGITSSDYRIFPWKRVRRPIYPLDPDTPDNLAMI